jgi:phenylacetate 2-hydroxylase
MCAGSHLANRELYTAFVRLITAFHIDAPRAPQDLPILDALDCNSIPTSLTTDPKPFKCGFRARNLEALQRWMRESEERTRGL